MYLRTHLGCAHFIEHNEHESLDEPREDQILSLASEQQPCAQCQAHLWYEAGQWRPEEVLPHRGPQRSLRGRIGEIHKVKVGREVVPVVQPVQVVEVRLL